MNNYDEIRKLIERRYRRQIILGFHLAVFVLIGVGTTVWMLTHTVYEGDLKNLWLFPGWAFIVFVHWAYFRLANARDREIEAAWTRYGREANYEKSKPDDANWMALSDEGELIDWTDEPSDVREKLKRHG
jgi:hypothetical protein